MNRLKLIFVLTTVVVALAACSSDDESGGGGGEVESADTAQSDGGGAYGDAGTAPAEGEAAAPAEGATAVTASGNAFSPPAITLTAGAPASLTVQNTDGVTHSFTFEDAQVDQDIQGGQSATVEFTAPAAGEYTYICKYHGGMTGTITVA